MLGRKKQPHQPVGLGGDRRQLFEHGLGAAAERFGVERGHRCAASQAPSFSRSSALMRVSLPSGMALVCTAWACTRRAYWRKIGRGFEPDALRCLGKAGMAGLAGVAIGAMVRGDPHHLGVGHLQGALGAPRRGGAHGADQREDSDRCGPAIGVEVVAGVVAIDQVPHQAAGDQDQRHHQPRKRMAVEHRVVARDHHQQHGQREIIVVQRALLADGAEPRVRRLARDQLRRHLFLVRDDHQKNIGGHDGADQRADMDECTAAGEDVLEQISRGDDQHESGGREQRRAIAHQAANEIIDEPACNETRDRDRDGYSRRNIQHRRIDQISARVPVILNDQ